MSVGGSCIYSPIGPTFDLICHLGRHTFLRVRLLLLDYSIAATHLSYSEYHQIIAIFHHIYAIVYVHHICIA